ncbi:hypothetical protein C8R46DRAFT_1024585 [Mycena filopes]|nr:hypothetical protein C8R46DRAFT_1024585 [Mycena filopes]
MPWHFPASLFAKESIQTKASSTGSRFCAQTVSSSSGTLSQNLPIIAKFPNVETLALMGYGKPEAHLAECDLLPELREYFGPPTPLVLFISRPHLTHLTILDCTTTELLAPLQAAPVPLNIVFLDASLDNVDNTTFQALCTLLPRLTALRLRITVQINDSDESNSDYANNEAITFLLRLLALTPALPRTLAHLALSWVFEQNDNPTAPDHDRTPDLAALRAALVARYCPALTSLWLDGFDFLFYWRKEAGEGFVDDLTLTRLSIADEAKARNSDTRMWFKAGFGLEDRNVYYAASGHGLPGR